MKFQNTSVMNFEGAFRGLRNPLQSWAKSDSFFGIVDIEYYGTSNIDSVVDSWVKQDIKKRDIPVEYESFEYFEIFDKYLDWIIDQGLLNKREDACDFAAIGPVDLGLAQRMIRLGASDRKFLRQILVSVDITAPLYWWKQFDTYKIGTTANSTSTMHKLSSTHITKDCFEMGDFDENMMMYENDPHNPDTTMSEFWDMFINDLEYLRQKYNETKNQKYWKELVRLLPNGWLQTRTVTLNYEILRNIYSQRKHHRLVEWHTFCDWVESLPYAKELILHGLDKNKNL